MHNSVVSCRKENLAEEGFLIPSMYDLKYIYIYLGIIHEEEKIMSKYAILVDILNVL